MTDYRYTSDLSVANDPQFVHALLSGHGKARVRSDERNHAKPQQRNHPYGQHGHHRPTEDLRHKPYRRNDHSRSAEDARYDTYVQKDTYRPPKDSRDSTHRQHDGGSYGEETRHMLGRHYLLERPRFYDEPQSMGSRLSLERADMRSKGSLLSRIS